MTLRALEALKYLRGQAPITIPAEILAQVDSVIAELDGLLNRPPPMPMRDWLRARWECFWSGHQHFGYSLCARCGAPDSD